MILFFDVCIYSIQHKPYSIHGLSQKRCKIYTKILQFIGIKCNRFGFNISYSNLCNILQFSLYMNLNMCPFDILPTLSQCKKSNCFDCTCTIYSIVYIYFSLQCLACPLQSKTENKQRIFNGLTLNMEFISQVRQDFFNIFTSAKR